MSKNRTILLSYVFHESDETFVFWNQNFSNELMQFQQNSLDTGIQDRSTSILIMYEIEEMSHEGEDDESYKRI